MYFCSAKVCVFYVLSKPKVKIFSTSNSLQSFPKEIDSKKRHQKP